MEDLVFQLERIAASLEAIQIQNENIISLLNEIHIELDWTVSTSTASNIITPLGEINMNTESLGQNSTNTQSLGEISSYVQSIYQDLQEFKFLSQ